MLPACLVILPERGRPPCFRTGIVASVALASPAENPLLVARVMSKCSMRGNVPRIGCITNMFRRSSHSSALWLVWE